MPKYIIRTRVVTSDTAKYFIIPMESLAVCLKDLTFLFIRQYKPWNDAQLRTAMVHCANTAVSNVVV